MLTVGDVVIIEDGDYVPADIRLFETVNLKVEESGLTGESLAVEKNTDKIDGTVGIGDRKNMAFSSSLVTYGRAKGYVIAVGMEIIRDVETKIKFLFIRESRDFRNIFKDKIMDFMGQQN